MNAKNTFRVLFTVIGLSAVIIFFHACRSTEEQGSSVAPATSSSLIVSTLFNFETMQNVDISIHVLSTETSPTPHIIKIYDNNPGTSGHLITTGITDASLLYAAVLRIPTSLDTVYIENYSVLADLSVIKVYQKVPVVAKKINYSFTMMTPVLNRKAGSFNDPGCSSGCTTTISTKVNSIQINDYEQICLTTHFNGSVTFNSSNGTGKLIVCGADTITNITVTGNGVPNIIVSNSGSLTLKNTSIAKLNITNYGNFYATSGFNVLKDRIFTNYGYALADVLTVTNGIVNNYSTFNVTREIDNNGTILNSNTLQVAGVINNNTGASLNNECKIEVMGDFQHYGSFSNKGYMAVSGNVQFNTGSKTTLAAQSNLEIARPSPQVKGQIAIDGDVTGPIQGSGKITVDGRTDILSNARFFNQIDICDADKIENLQITLPPNVTFCKSFIPVTDCTPKSGNPVLADQDGDGVPDVLDEFPTNPDRAFTSYYPNNGTFATLCFNDLWPSNGKGILNALVVDFQYKIITNSNNQVVDIYGTFHPRAEGAAVDNAFAVAFPVPPSSVQTIDAAKIYGPAAKNIFKMTPLGYEAGHLNNTVIPVINSVYYYYNANYYINVWPQATFYSLPEEINMHVQFATPIPSSQLIPPYNPFLIHNSNRNYEIHLIDHPPTELVDSKSFGTDSDRSIITKGLYYRDANNLPWVIEVPVSFDYPIALTDIINAYKKYSEWAQSNGTKSKDWYLDKPGYRNATNIYPKR